MELTLANILTGCLVVGVTASVGLILNQRSQLVRIETVLTGADGTNGLNGDVKQLKEWRQEIEGEALPRRVEALESRPWPYDRRQSHA